MRFLRTELLRCENRAHRGDIELHVVGNNKHIIEKLLAVFYNRHIERQVAPRGRLQQLLQDLKPCNRSRLSAFCPDLFARVLPVPFELQGLYLRAETVDNKQHFPRSVSLCPASAAIFQLSVVLPQSSRWIGRKANVRPAFRATLLRAGAQEVAPEEAPHSPTWNAPPADQGASRLKMIVQASLLERHCSHAPALAQRSQAFPLPLLLPLLRPRSHVLPNGSRLCRPPGPTMHVGGLLKT
mmetsp:Transcript_11993/g.36545  ORF Transcript_11993/g.36545 Transcript_11993/m.36545 type:complete len:240 (+) Transcript_11993:546-1265(+)